MEVAAAFATTGDGSELGPTNQVPILGSMAERKLGATGAGIQPEETFLFDI